MYIRADRRCRAILRGKVFNIFTCWIRRRKNAENLSPRKEQVLDSTRVRIYLQGNRGQTDISVETVRTYVKNICNKMHVRTGSKRWRGIGWIHME